MTINNNRLPSRQAFRLLAFCSMIAAFCVQAQPVEEQNILQVAPEPTRVTRTEVIRLEITDSGTLDLRSPSKCPATDSRPAFPENGCVRAVRNEILDLEFSFGGNRSNDACKSPYQYELDGIQLANKNGLKPSLSQWDSPADPLDAEVAADFPVDKATGWVKHAINPNGNIGFTNNNQSSVGYFIWYRVRATCSDPNKHHSIYYDPRYDNEGTS